MVELEVPALVPPRFARALAAVRAAPVRAEVELEAIAAPVRMAPHAVALSARVPAPDGRGGPGRARHGGAGEGGAGPEDGEDPVTGRLVLLHDPAGQPSWSGTFRVVTLTRAVLAVDLVDDPLVGAVAWSWLREALAARGVDPVALGGTVTRVLSQPFGDLAGGGWERWEGQGDVGGEVEAEVELRASWTPTEASAGASVAAWTDVLCSAAGRPHLPAGVAALPSRPR